MEIIGSVFGIAAAASFLPLIIKYPLRKLGFERINAHLMKLHEAASAGFWLFGIIHAVISLVRGKGGRLTKASGAFSLALGTWLITDCHIAKDYEKKMFRHRCYSLALTASLLCHIFSAVRRK